LPSSPSRFSAGITQSSNWTCEVGCASPAHLVFRRAEGKPGVPSSTSTADMPLGPSPPVRVITEIEIGKPPPEINALVPLSL
jgi:hypothetical protein